LNVSPRLCVAGTLPRTLRGRRDTHHRAAHSTQRRATCCSAPGCHGGFASHPPHLVHLLSLLRVCAAGVSQCVLEPRVQLPAADPRRAGGPLQDHHDPGRRGGMAVWCFPPLMPLVVVGMGSWGTMRAYHKPCSPPRVPGNGAAGSYSDVDGPCLCALRRCPLCTPTF
jgi:hypothetical protein